MVSLSLSNSCTLTLIAPANKRNGNITLTSNSLKSNFLVISITLCKKSGKIAPKIVVIIERQRAKTSNLLFEVILES